MVELLSSAMFAVIPWAWILRSKAGALEMEEVLVRAMPLFFGKRTSMYPRGSANFAATSLLRWL